MTALELPEMPTCFVLGASSGPRLSVEARRPSPYPLLRLYSNTFFCTIPRFANSSLQGLTLAHFSAQLECCIWHRGFA